MRTSLPALLPKRCTVRVKSEQLTGKNTEIGGIIERYIMTGALQK